MRNLLLVGALTEMFVALVALFANGGPSDQRGIMAMVGALLGSGIAFGAQIVAVSLLRPAMGAETPKFAKAWVVGMGLRFGSFLVLAVLIITLRDTLPPLWVATGYLGTLLVLLFAETRFLT